MPELHIVPPINSKSSATEQAAQILVGTSGYSYGEWADAGFYPPGTKPARMLPLYAEQFPVTELNYTWYQMPKAQATERQRRQAPPGFLFAAKLTRNLTHDVDPKTWREQAEQYRNGISPLIQARQLIAVLIQLGPGFERTNRNRSYLAQLLDSLDGLPLAVEFRHRSWANDRVFAGLESRRVALVSVDEPELPGLFPPLDIVTSPDLFYVRFHGRNAKGWRSGNMQFQFDYNYTHDELTEWVEEKISRMAKKSARGVIFFNNHVRGQAPNNARSLREILRDRGLLPKRKS